MKSFYARGVCLALGLLSLTQAAHGDTFGTPSMLPIPDARPVDSQVMATAFNRRYQPNGDNQPSPSDVIVEPTLTPAHPTPAPQVVEPGSPASSPAWGCEAPPMSHDYRQAMTQSWADGCGESCGTACGTGCCNRWAITAGGLILGRANQSNHNLSRSVDNYTTELTTKDAGQQYAGGFEIGLSRLLGCDGCNAIQFTYWGLYPSDESAMRMAGNYPPGGLRPAIGSNLNWLSYDNGVNNYDMDTWMTTATGIHEVRRTFDYHNFESNYLVNSYAWGLRPIQYNCGCGPRCQVGWLAGFRYFRFDETTTFYTDYDDTVLDADNNEFRYGLETENNLYGFQMGGQFTYAINNCWNIYGGGRAGVYNNHIEHRQFVSHPNSGNYAEVSNGTYNGEAYLVEAERDALAVLGQIDLGLRYNFGCCLSLEGGYRVIGLSGVATSDGQLADNFADPRMAAAIKADDSVLLHGVYLGGTYRW
jgi:hypothetical protein